MRAIVALTVFLTAAGARGEDWRTVRDRVDELVEARLRADGVEPGPPAAETTLLRRTYLDLTGVIPTVGEVRGHLADPSDDRHERLVDRLVGNAAKGRPQNPRFATHLATRWRRTLLTDTGNRVVQIRAGQFEAWLRERFAANVPYDELVRELLLAEGNLNDPGPVLYYVSLESKPEKLAASTSRAFLGVQMECAECHDHPFDRWTQRDFWGYAAFFAQLRRGGTVPGRVVSAVEDVDTGEARFPETDEVVPPRFLGAEEVSADHPDRNRRERLADWIVDSRNPYFARAAVNRAWALLFGYGLVDPVDDFGDHNPPSHPEVLDLLAEDFAANGYDLQRTLRILANTRTYARTSVVRDGESFEPQSYARMPIKPLTGEQVYDAIARATLLTPVPVTNGYIGFGRGAPGDRESFLAKFRGAESATEFQGGIPRTLTLANGPFVANRTDATSSDLLISVAESPFLDDAAAVETLFLATLSRPPTSAERERFVPHVTDRTETADRVEPLADVLWALVNSGEFLLNH